MSTQRERAFWIRTYLKEDQLKALLEKNLSIIYRYAYAYHDKDVSKRDESKLAEPHFHLLIRFTDKYSISKVRKLFSGFVDEKGLEINSNIQFREKTDAHCIQYLVHKNDSEKYQYSADCITAFNYDVDEELAKQLSDDVRCETSLIFATLFEQGWSSQTLKRLIAEYGRDFVHHYQNYKKLYFDVIELEHHEEVFRNDNIITKDGELIEKLDLPTTREIKKIM